MSGGLLSSGKAASLTANEKTVTPNLSASPGLGPHHAPPKAVTPKAPKTKSPAYVPPPMIRVNVKPPTVTTAQKVYHATSTKPFFLNQKPDHFASLGRLGLIPIYVYGHGKPGPTGDDKTQLNSNQLAFAAHEKYISEGGLPGALLRDTATSLVPKTFVDLAQGNHVTGSHVVSDIANAALNFAPAGKAAGILGGLKGLKALKDTVDVARLAPDEVKALQIVKEGVPLEKRLAEAKGKELKDLKAAAKHVHDVNGVPRIVPSNHKLIEAYQTAEAHGVPVEAQVVKGAMRGLKATRGKQEAAYSAERTARAAAIHSIYTDKSLTVAEREAKASAALKGELPKVNFGGLQELTPDVVNVLKQHIMEHPNILAYQKKRLVSSLGSLAEGKIPTKSELDLYEHAFGKATADSLRQGDKQSFLDNILRVANIPRSLMASFDVSAPMRQGLVALARHPVISGKNIAPMFKALKSEDYFQNQIIGDIEKRPTYPLMLESKLAITKLGSDVGAREERFPTDLAEKIPVVGIGVRGSGRAYNGYLDKTRADIFDHLINKAQDQGVNIHDQKFLHGLGSLVNNATGRGDLGSGALHEAGKFLNTFFFSPRLLASRVNIIAAPLKYARADPYVRREALKTWLSLAGTLTTVLGALSQVPGLKVVTDPRNPDWGKVKKGNTRIDLAGGFQQPLRLAAQLATGVAISSTTGKQLNLTSSGFGQPTRLDLFLRFFEGKEAPWASLTTDWLRNSDQVGNKFSWKGELGQRITPLLAQDAYDIYKAQHGGVDGITAAFGAYALGATGVGLQTYGPKKTKSKSGSSGGFGSPGLLGGGGSSSSGGGLLSGG